MIRRRLKVKALTIKHSGEETVVYSTPEMANTISAAYTRTGCTVTISETFERMFEMPVLDFLSNAQPVIHN